MKTSQGKRFHELGWGGIANLTELRDFHTVYPPVVGPVVCGGGSSIAVVLIDKFACGLMQPLDALVRLCVIGVASINLNLALKPLLVPPLKCRIMDEL